MACCSRHAHTLDVHTHGSDCTDRQCLPRVAELQRRRPASCAHVCASVCSITGALAELPLWQGGKEAARSNALLHSLIVGAVAEAAPMVGRDLISLVTSRQGVDDLLKLDDVIDLVRPPAAAAFSVTCSLAQPWQAAAFLYCLMQGASKH